MKRFAVVFWLVTSCVWALDEPALPAWQGTERTDLLKKGWVAGALLLTDDPTPESSGSLGVELPTAEEIAGDSAPSNEVSEEYLAGYFAERPKSFLVDPQKLLTAPQYRDRLGFLNYHASDSAIDLFVYVIGGNQEIPSEVRKEEMIERFFATGRPAAIIYYYLGAPQRSVVYLSPSINGTIPSAEQHRALESSVMQAFEKTDPAEQLEKFLVQMSIRIYWMERMLAGERAPGGEPVLSAAPATARPAAAGKLAKYPWLTDFVAKSMGPAGVVLAALLTVFGFNRWLSRRARYRFPEFEVEPRLGGAHAAGVGAVISFASAALPPASQRDQVPDYLRRA